MTRRKRSQKDLQRKRPFKAQFPTVLIVCEGGKTEPLYFHQLKRKLRIKSVTIEICGHCGVPDTLVSFATSKKVDRKRDTSLDPYEKIWCVFDTEGPQNRHPNLKRAYDDAIAKKYSVAVSNPCFEYWFLLHYQETAKPAANCTEIIQELKRHYSEYQKGHGKIFNDIYDKTDKAIERARRFMEIGYRDEDVIDRNPSTYVFLLVDYLKNIPILHG